MLRKNDGTGKGSATHDSGGKAASLSRYEPKTTSICIMQWVVNLIHTRASFSTTGLPGKDELFWIRREEDRFDIVHTAESREAEWCLESSRTITSPTNFVTFKMNRLKTSGLIANCY